MTTLDLPTAEDFLRWARKAAARATLRPQELAFWSPTRAEFALVWTMQAAPDVRLPVPPGARRVDASEVEPETAAQWARDDARRRRDATTADNLAHALAGLLPASLASGLAIAAGSESGAAEPLAFVRSSAERAPAWWSAYPPGADAHCFTAALLERLRLIAEGAPLALGSAFQPAPGEVIDPLTLGRLAGSWSACELRARGRLAREPTGRPS